MWKDKMMNILDDDEVYEVVIKTIIEPDPIDIVALATYNKKNRHARKLITLNIADHILLHVRGILKTCDQWDKLKKLYESATNGRVLHLKNQLYSLKLKLKESVIHHIDKVKELRSHLAEVVHTIEDKELVDIVLISLHHEYKHFVTTINITYKDQDLSLDDLQSFLMNEDKHEEEEEEKEFMTKTKGKGKW